MLESDSNKKQGLRIPARFFAESGRRSFSHLSPTVWNGLTRASQKTFPNTGTFQTRSELSSSSMHSAATSAAT